MLKKLIKKNRRCSHLAGLEPATFRLTAERANRLRHRCSTVIYEHVCNSIFAEVAVELNIHEHHTHIHVYHTQIVHTHTHTYTHTLKHTPYHTHMHTYHLGVNLKPAGAPQHHLHGGGVPETQAHAAHGVRRAWLPQLPLSLQQRQHDPQTQDCHPGLCVCCVFVVCLLCVCCVFVVRLLCVCCVFVVCKCMTLKHMIAIQVCVFVVCLLCVCCV